LFLNIFIHQQYGRKNFKKFKKNKKHNLTKLITHIRIITKLHAQIFTCPQKKLLTSVSETIQKLLLLKAYTALKTKKKNEI